MKWFFKKNKHNAPAERECQMQVTGPEDFGPTVEEVRTPASALKIAAAYRCVRIVSETIARLPLEVQRYNRTRRYYTDYPESALWRLLCYRPNANQTAFQFFRQLVQEVLLLGNAYVYPRRNARTLEVEELVLLTPGTVYVDSIGPRWSYTVMDVENGVSGTFAADELIHVRNLSLDGGATGLSTISFAARVLGIAAMGDQETGKRFATGGKIKAIYHQETDGMRGFSSGVYDGDELKNSANDIEKRLNSGRSIISVPGAGKLDPLSLTSTDMQFLESRKFTVTEIARFFGVPKAKVMDDTNANYKSTEQANIDFYSDGLAPLMAQIEQEFSKLIPDSVVGDFRLQYNLRQLYQTDLQTRADIDAKELANGTKTVNELRRRDGMPPVEGGDRALVSANLLPLDSVLQKSTNSGQPMDNITGEE